MFQYVIIGGWALASVTKSLLQEPGLLLSNWPSNFQRPGTRQALDSQE